MVSEKMFKQTEIGLLPNDWDAVTVRDVATIFGRIGFRGYTISDIVKEGEGAISLSPSNIKNGKIHYKTCTYLSWTKYEESPEIKIFNDDVLLVKTGSTVGKSSIVRNLKEKATLNPQIVVFKRIKIDNKLFSYLVFDRSFQNQIISAVVGGAIPTLSQEQVYNFQIPLPPPPEQKTIAKALSDTDAWIENLENLIAKKSLIKQGTMQKLLKPKEDWELKKLEDVADIIGGGTPSTFTNKFWKGDITWFTPTEVGYTKYLFESKRKITPLGLKNSSGTILPINSILLTTRAGIGDLGILKVEACTNQGFQSIVCKSNSNYEFIYYLMQTKRNELLSNASGSTFLEISPKKVKTLKIHIPSHEEQTRIAKILSDMDTEIEGLENQFKKARQLKQGMMQELLTGRTRLV